MTLQLCSYSGDMALHHFSFLTTHHGERLKVKQGKSGAGQPRTRIKLTLRPSTAPEGTLSQADSSEEAPALSQMTSEDHDASIPQPAPSISSTEGKESDDEIVITPLPPAPKHHCTTLQAATSKKSKAVIDVGQPKQEQEEKEDEKLVLLIPHASNNGLQCKTIPAETGYNEALTIIWDTIGCSDVACKPDLQYKLTSAAQKDNPIGLNSAKDWTGLVEDLLTIQHKKKTGIQVKILVTDQQYLCSLRTSINNGKSTLSWTKTKKGKKAEPILDLDHEEDNDADEGGLMEKEQKAWEQLEKALGQCQLCSPHKICKISQNGEHMELSFQQC
ncbi:hypothetical protein NLJ89_g2754 [Agrocybe chaxingu]|uniref:Uncharacterized protein n=1 Tax=Agrocybe chaxingu TaxID=84603 RepID=A0A9W8K672_9AGAR|nr:hypothetical protein NLJ89_g2754 [Agrocybe chaxingu]